MTRILFVDDEVNILNGLRRTLRGQRSEWEMEFAEGGEPALAMAEQAPFDVLVSDMRMPGMDGAVLLQKFHDLYPRTIRLVLSGHAELESVMRAVPVAHQFLSKPCDGAVLKEAVSRAFELQRLLNAEPATRLMGAMDGLPARPATYSAVVEALANPEIEVADVAAIIEQDSAMTAKILQLVNSGFFGMPQRVTDVGKAAMFLGLATVRDLVLSIEIFRRPAGSEADLDAFLDELQQRLNWTAAVARKLNEDKKVSQDAFTAGLLHDIGMFVLATKLPVEYAEVLARSQSESRPLALVEQEVLGVSHASVGAYLLGVWGLPYSIMQIAGFHDRPSELDANSFDALGAVHVASALVASRMAESGAKYPCDGVLDLAYLEALGLSDRVDEWGEIVEAACVGEDS